MSEHIGHECGIALVRMLKPLAWQKLQEWQQKRLLHFQKFNLLSEGHLERLGHLLHLSEQFGEAGMSTLVYFHPLAFDVLLEQLSSGLGIDDVVDVVNCVLDESVVNVDADYNLGAQLSGNLEGKCASMTANIQNSLVFK